jgi:hypothetical protein
LATNIYSNKKNFTYVTFFPARDFARSLGLKNRQQWRNYCKSGGKPKEIPAMPDRTYEDRGWISYGDWLGTGRIATQKMRFRKFDDARDFARSLKLRGQKEWKAYCTSGKKPDNIPSNPHHNYRYDGWIGYGDWLGTGSVASHRKQFMGYYEAKKFVHGLNLNGVNAWRLFCKSGKKPSGIPVNPDAFYRQKGWEGYGEWLGTGTIAHKDRKFMIFVDARSFVRSLDLKNSNEWKRYCTSGKKPSNIPSAPYKTYRNEGWYGFKDWLGRKGNY